MDRQHESDSGILDESEAHFEETRTEDQHAGVWQEDHPPVDDFHDVTHEVVEGEGDGEDLAPANGEAAKKRGKMVLVGVVGVGLLFAGGLAYVQMSGGSGGIGAGGSQQGIVLNEKPLSSEDAAAATAAPDAKGGEAKVAAGALPVTPTSAEVDMSALYNSASHDQATGSAGVAVPGQGVEAVAPSAPVAPAAPVAPSVAEAAKPVPAQAPVATVAAPTPAPAAAPAPVQAVAASAPVAVPAPVVVPAAPVVASAPAPVASPAPVAPSVDTSGLEARLTALAAQVETLQKSLDKSAQQIGVLTGKVEAVPAAPVVVNAAPASNPVVDARLAKIEQQLAGLAARPVPLVKEPVQVKEPVAAKEPVAVKEAAVVPAPVVVAEKVEPITAAPVLKTAHVTARHAAKKAVRKAHHGAKAQGKASGKWVLRAATPNAAWIAKGESATDLRRVKVGDTVPGLGKVRAIKQAGDSWVVVGSKGSLR